MYQNVATDKVERIPLARSKVARRMDLTVREMVKGEVAIWYIFFRGKIILFVADPG